MKGNKPALIAYAVKDPARRRGESHLDADRGSLAA